MSMAVCAARNARDACQLALRTLTPPRISPSKDLLEAPIWTTWARYFSRVTQDKVLKYAHEIVSRGLQVHSPRAHFARRRRLETAQFCCRLASKVFFH
jgi:hypothetical protein